MILPSILLAAIAVLPTDRMAMADRLFNRSEWAEAKREYLTLVGADGIPADELEYRLAECDRALGDEKAARERYARLIGNHPNSRFVARARLQRALSLTDAAEKTGELRLLDSDGVPNDIRAAALYHLGTLSEDVEAYGRCLKLDPKGLYSEYARFRKAVAESGKGSDEQRRAAIGQLLEIAFGKNTELAEEAVHIAAVRSYAEAKYGEASSLFRRYLKSYPKGRHAGEVRTMAAWSDYLSGRYADAVAICGTQESDDFDYLRAACAYASGDNVRAKELYAAYLEKHPRGNYRETSELPLSRISFAEAEKAGDLPRAIECARRAAAISKSSSDRLRLAWALERGGDEAAATAEYVAVARDAAGTPDAAEAMFRKGIIDVRAQRWSAADLAFSEALSAGASGPRKSEALYWRAVASHRLGHVVEGCRFAREALKAGLGVDRAREARLMLADEACNAGRTAESKAAYAKLVREGACDRMSAAKILAVGKFLLSVDEGEDANDAAKLCAKALSQAADSAEWRQAAAFLEGQADEAAGEFAAALSAYRRGFAENVRTEDAGRSALCLGILETRAGDNAAAEKTLEESVRLNASDGRRRAESYLWLAKSCEARGDFVRACGYATVLMQLFDDAELNAEARKILEAHPTEAER